MYEIHGSMTSTHTKQETPHFYIDQDKRICRMDKKDFLQTDKTFVKSDGLRDVAKRLVEIFKDMKEEDFKKNFENQQGADLQNFIQSWEEFNESTEKLKDKIDHSWWRFLLNLFGWYEVDKVPIPEKIKQLEVKKLTAEVEELSKKDTSSLSISDLDERMKTIDSKINEINRQGGDITPLHASYYTLNMKRQAVKQASEKLDKEYVSFQIMEQVNLIRGRREDPIYWQEISDIGERMTKLYSILKTYSDENSVESVEGKQKLQQVLDFPSKRTEELKREWAAVLQDCKKTTFSATPPEVLVYKALRNFKEYQMDYRLPPDEKDFRSIVSKAIDEQRVKIVATLTENQQKINTLLEEEENRKKNGEPSLSEIGAGRGIGSLDSEGARALIGSFKLYMKKFDAYRNEVGAVDHELAKPFYNWQKAAWARWDKLQS